MHYEQDNRALGSWPMRKVVKVEGVPNRLDNLPFAQLVTLECGHRVTNTYGTDEFDDYQPGDMLRCRTCGGTH